MKTTFTILIVLLVSLLSGLSHAQHTLSLTPVEDAYVQTYGGGEGKNSFLKFDISALPANAVITDTRFRAWVYRQSALWNGDLYYIFYINQAWEESDSTQEMWNTLWFGDTISQAVGTFGMSVGFSQSPDLTSMLLTNFSGGDTYFSFFTKDPDDMTFAPPIGQPIYENSDSLLAGNIFNDNCAFRPRNYVNPNQRPVLVIDYGIPPDVFGIFSGGPVCEGDAVTITASVSGDAPMCKQWLKNGIPLVGDTSLTLVINPATLSDTGTYRLFVYNAFGSDTSMAVDLVIRPVPVISLGPDTTVCLGTGVLLDPGPGFDTYMWNTGFTGQWIIADTVIPGTFVYSVAVSHDGCFGSDSVNVTFIICSGTEELESDAYGLSPNPSSDGIFRFHMDDFPAEVSVYDLQGKLLHREILHHSENILNLQKLQKGYYVLFISGEDFSAQRSLIIR